jgi:hypothetical protein
MEPEHSLQCSQTSAIGTLSRASLIKMAVFCHAAPPSLVCINGRLSWAYCLYHQGDYRDSKSLCNDSQYLPDLTRLCDTSESSHLHNSRCEKLKSHHSLIKSTPPHLTFLRPTLILYAVTFRFLKWFLPFRAFGRIYNIHTWYIYGQSHPPRL